MTVRRDQRPYNVAYYARNREAEITRVTTRQRATLQWLRELRRVPCADCGGMFPPYVMDFDHRDPAAKSFSVAADKVLLKNRLELEAEIAKCDIVCANCHRIRTAAQYANGILEYGYKPSPTPAATPRAQYRREHFLSLRAAQMEIFDRVRALPCADCGKTYPMPAMEFDHRDPRQKRGHLSYLAGRVRIAAFLEELAKCDIVCANCHHERTYHRRVCRDAGCPRVWCSGSHAILPRLKGGFDPRYPLGKDSGQLRLIEEAALRYAA